MNVNELKKLHDFLDEIVKKWFNVQELTPFFKKVVQYVNEAEKNKRSAHTGRPISELKDAVNPDNCSCIADVISELQKHGMRVSYAAGLLAEGAKKAEEDME